MKSVTQISKTNINYLKCSVVGSANLIDCRLDSTNLTDCFSALIQAVFHVGDGLWERQNWRPKN